MDIRRIQDALYNDGKFMINTHVALPNGEHTNVYLEGNPLAGIKADDRDGILYAISTFFHGLLWNSNIKVVFYLAKDDALPIAVANQLKVPAYSLHDELLRSAADAGKYAIISTHISKYAAKDINDFISNTIKKPCDFVGCMASEFDVNMADDIMASSSHSIISLPRTEFFNQKDCPMCKMGKPLFVKKEISNGKPGQGSDGRGSSGSGTDVLSKQPAGPEQIQSPSQRPERDNTGRESSAGLTGDTVQSNVEPSNGRDRFNDVDRNIGQPEEGADGDLTESSRRVHGQGRGTEEQAVPEERSESGLRFTDDDEAGGDAVEGSESAAAASTKDVGDLTSGG